MARKTLTRPSEIYDKNYLNYLISEIVKESIENLEEKEGSSPGSVAREIAKNLLKKDELR